MGQRAVRVAQLFAEAGDQRAGQADRAGDGDLLSQHRSHRQFESVPGAGDAQARAGGDQRREGGVLDQLQRDRVGVGGEVEHPAQARNDLRQARRVSGSGPSPAGHVRRPGGPDGALLAVQADGPAVDVRPCTLSTPGNRSGAQETQHRGPVVGRAVAQQQADFARGAGGNIRGRRRRSAVGGRLNKV